MFPFAARFRHVVADWPVDSTLADLKAKIRVEMAASLPTTDSTGNRFTLANLGKTIDADENKSLAQVGALDGDIITIHPC